MCALFVYIIHGIVHKAALTSDWPRAGMFPGATAPSAPPGYSTVQIVPGLTAVLPPGFVVPPFTVVAGVILVPPCHWFTLSGACLLHALIMGPPVLAACIALLSVGLPLSITSRAHTITITVLSQHRKPFATSLCILLQAFSCTYIAVLAICIVRLSFILHRCAWLVHRVSRCSHRPCRVHACNAFFTAIQIVRVLRAHTRCACMAC